MAGFHRILVATDGSSTCEAAVDRAVDLAACLGSELIVLSVATGGEAEAADLDSASDPLGAAEEATMALSQRHLAASTERALEGATRAAGRCAARGVPARPIVWEGAAGESIVAAAAAEGADLVVVGSHCRGGVGRLLMGSVSDHVVRHAPVPVMVVRPTATPESTAAGQPAG
jgi:nucleotide-binding universal stress UspA family protein